MKITFDKKNKKKKLPGRRILNSDPIGSDRKSHTNRQFPTGILCFPIEFLSEFVGIPGTGFRSEVAGRRIRWIPMDGSDHRNISETTGSDRFSLTFYNGTRYYLYCICGIPVRQATTKKCITMRIPRLTVYGAFTLVNDRIFPYTVGKKDK